jgi:hypothetical protein
MKSIRLDGKLEWRLARTAERLHLSESEVIRRALDDYCDLAPGDSLADALGDYVGAMEGTGEDLSSNTHELYGAYLFEKHIKRQQAHDLRIAERNDPE